MKCQKCGRYTNKLKDDYHYCKVCNLVFWFLIPGAPPRIFVMGDNSKRVAH